MDINRWFKIGDRIKITVDGGSYNTIVERVEDDNGLYIATPQSRLMPVVPEKDEVYPISTTVKNGVMTFDARVDGIDMNDNIPLVKMTAINEPRRVQRRDSFRTAVMLDVSVKRVEDGEAEEVPAYDTKTLNISEGGMLFFHDGRFEAGDILECDISLDRFGMKRKLEGTKAVVTRVENTEDGKQRAAVSFTNFTGKSRDCLLKFIIYSQRKKND